MGGKGEEVRDGVSEARMREKRGKGDKAEGGETCVGYVKKVAESAEEHVCDTRM